MKWLLIVLLWAAPAEAAVDVAVPMGESAFEWKALLGEAAGWMGQVDGDVELPGSETKRWLLTEERIVRDIVRCATCKGDLAVSAMTSN